MSQQKPHTFGSIVNLTPHNVVVKIPKNDLDPTSGDSVWVNIPATGQQVRVKSSPQPLVCHLQVEAPIPLRASEADAYAARIPVVKPPSFPKQDPLSGFPYGPDDKEHPPVVVSMLVAPRIPRWYRGQVYSPDMGPGSAVRDNKGKPMAVKRLCLWAPMDRDA